MDLLLSIRSHTIFALNTDSSVTKVSDTSGDCSYLLLTLEDFKDDRKRNS